MYCRYILKFCLGFCNLDLKNCTCLCFIKNFIQSIINNLFWKGVHRIKAAFLFLTNQNIRFIRWEKKWEYKRCVALLPYLSRWDCKAVLYLLKNLIENSASIPWRWRGVQPWSADKVHFDYQNHNKPHAPLTTQCNQWTIKFILDLI